VDIKAQILLYRDHIDDWDYVDSVLQAAGNTQNLFDALIEILQTGDWDCLEATSFILDLCLFAPKRLGQEFVKMLDASTVIEALRKNVFAANHFVRGDSVYTLGKLINRESANTLVEAFYQFKERDPLMLDGLLFEIRWLKQSTDWTLIEAMAQSSSYLTRWAALEVLEHFVDFDADSRCQHHLSILQKDEQLLVQQEAVYLHRELQFLEEIKNLPKSEKRKRRKALEKTKLPIIRFWDISRQFSNRLGQRQQSDYQVAELEQFVEEFTASHK